MVGAARDDPAMLAVHLLTLLALAEAPALPPSRPLRAWWLPVVTLRLTHRELRALALDLDAATTPLGTTLELRLEWGGATSPSP